MADPSQPVPDSIRLPAPTPWPIVMAFGVTLMAAGLVTSDAVSLAGSLLAVVAAVGWFGEVLPSEAFEVVRAEPSRPLQLRRRAVARVPIASELRRAWLPLEIYPVAAGIK